VYSVRGVAFEQATGYLESRDLLLLSRENSDLERYASGYECCQEKWAKVTFEDADIFDDHLPPRWLHHPIQSLLQDPIQQRGGCREDRQGHAHVPQRPTEIYNDAVITTKQAIIKLGGPIVSFPHLIPGSDLDDFCRGFADVLANLSTTKLSSPTG
jgi:hypothetical protein